MNFINLLKDKYNIALNEQQQKAVLSIDGPVLLLAVPGGGKTTVIVSRCANMIFNHNIKPENILTLTFSRASAIDMKTRFQRIFGNDINQDVHFSTIHSFCYSVLRTHAIRSGIKFPRIIEGEQSPVTKAQLLKQIYLKLNNEYINDEKLDELSNEICYVKNMMIPVEEIDETKFNSKNFVKIYRAYEDYKQADNLMDYDDMLTRALDIFNRYDKLANIYREKYRYINIDESQDTSLLQHEIIKILAKPANNIFMVGDEDQSIYSFRAAFPKALLDFEKAYPGAQVLLMERNYRSTKSIADAANAFIKQNKERYDKNMFSDNSDGETIKLTCLEEKNEQYEYITSVLADENMDSDIAILYRNNISAIPLADALEREGILFYLRDYKTYFFKHWVTTDIISFLNLSINTNDVNAFEKIYYKMNAYLSRTMLEYASNNTRPDTNLFDTLLICPDVNPKMANRIREIKKVMAIMPGLKPVKAVETIYDIIGYGDYLERISKESGYSLDNLTQIIYSLKSIAARSNSIQDFLIRLDKLQHIMETAKFNKGKASVTLSTIHSSKGLEFDKVFIIDLFDGQFPSNTSIGEHEEGKEALMEEEVRLFYVGVTRAKKHLELLTARTLDGKSIKPSRFINKLLKRSRRNMMRRGTKKDLHDVDLSKYKVTPIKGISDLYTGKKILHSMLGIGDVRFIDVKMDFLEVSFESCGLKLLSLKVCMKESLISALEDA